MVISLILTFGLIFQSFDTTKNNLDNLEISKTCENCDAMSNLDEICDSYISRCRLGSIRRVFPGEFLNVTLNTVRSGKTKKHKRAWKLLTDNRFSK